MKKLQLCLSLLAIAAFSEAAFSQGEILYSEDFEHGSPGWTLSNTQAGLWRLSEDGECLSESRMLAYHRGERNCDYNQGKGVSHSGSIFSPPVLLQGIPAYSITLNYKRSIGAGDSTEFFAFDVQTQQSVLECIFTDCSFSSDNSGTMQTATFLLSPYANGKTIVFGVHFTANGSQDQFPGFYLDNVEVLNFGSLSPPIVAAQGSHYLSIETTHSFPEDVDLAVVLAVRSPAFRGVEKYVAADGSISDFPIGQTIDQWGSLIVSGEEILPSTDYEVVAHLLLPIGAWVSSDSVADSTWLPGDANNSGNVNLDDILLVLLAFSGDFSMVSPWAADQAHVDGMINLDDLLAVLANFAGN